MRSILHSITSALGEGIGSLGADGSALQGFLHARLNPDGAFQGRNGRSDLYYTAFGAELLALFPEDPDARRTAEFLLRQDPGASPGFMDLVGLARARMRLLPHRTPRQWRHAMADRIASFRCADGTFHTQPDARTGTATSTFMAWTALEALELLPATRDSLLAALDRLKSPGGGYANLPGLSAGNVPATAAVITLRMCLAAEPSPAACRWMLEACHDSGGFRAFPDAPLPDLLSTGTALLALAAQGMDTRPIAPLSRAFIADRRDGSGGYTGHAFDSTADVEYTYYAMLGLGSLCTPAGQAR